MTFWQSLVLWALTGSILGAAFHAMPRSRHPKSQEKWRAFERASDRFTPNAWLLSLVIVHAAMGPTLLIPIVKEIYRATKGTA